MAAMDTTASRKTKFPARIIPPNPYLKGSNWNELGEAPQPLLPPPGSPKDKKKGLRESVTCVPCLALQWLPRRNAAGCSGPAQLCAAAPLLCASCLRSLKWWRTLTGTSRPRPMRGRGRLTAKPSWSSRLAAACVCFETAMLVIVCQTHSCLHITRGCQQQPPLITRVAFRAAFREPRLSGVCGWSFLTEQSQLAARSR